MFNRVPAMAFATTLLIVLAGCKSGPPEVMNLATVGAPNSADIATLDDMQSTQSAGPTHTPGGEYDNRGFVCAPTESDGDDSKYVEGAPTRESIIPDGTEGDKLTLSGTVYMVTEGGCQPLEGAIVDIWHADAQGSYDTSDDFLYRGKATTNAEGQYRFETIIPGEFLSQPKRIHLMIQHSDAASLTTQLYFEGDARLTGISPESPRVLHLAEENGIYTSSFDIVLSGK